MFCDLPRPIGFCVSLSRQAYLFSLFSYILEITTQVEMGLLS